jgi:hypothetical protein
MPAAIQHQRLSWGQPDVAAAHINPLEHFINNGIYEGRATAPDGRH